MADDAAAPPAAPAGAENPVKPAEFPDVSGAVSGAAGSPNIDMVRDIKVMLTVELGRAEMVIQDIIELAPGKVIELEKPVGEALDVLINGKLLARGEVVMVDDRFGIRITSIVDVRTRENALKQ
jgi:flagellar motor switch protein FliN